MLERSREKILPISWVGWDSIKDYCIQYYEVIFEGDFGTIKAGERYDMICIDYCEGEMELFNDNEENDLTPVCTINFKIIPDYE